MPCLRAKCFISVIYAEYSRIYDGKIRLKISAKTDILTQVVAAGLSVFVGIGLKCFPTFAVMVVVHLTVAAAVIMAFHTGIIS